MLPLGVVAQAVVGGIVVLDQAQPGLVAVHFLLSSAISSPARSCCTRGPRARATARPAAPPVRMDLRVLAGLLDGGHRR